MRNCKYILGLCVVCFVMILSGAVFASAWVGCDVSAQVIEKTQDGALVIRILSVTDQNSGFGACPLKAGDASLEIRISDPKEGSDIAKGETILLEYLEGSSMTPNGVTSYQIWNLR